MHHVAGERHGAGRCRVVEILDPVANELFGYGLWATGGGDFVILTGNSALPEGAFCEDFVYLAAVRQHECWRRRGCDGGD